MLSHVEYLLVICITLKIDFLYYQYTYIICVSRMNGNKNSFQCIKHIFKLRELAVVNKNYIVFLMLT